MKQERLNLYQIDMKYVRNLHHKDDRVSSVSPQIGKQNRVYIGIVVVANDRKYLIPLSHPVKKHNKMKTRVDFDKILDADGKLIGVLNYNLMIPVEDNMITKVDISSISQNTPEERHYRQLCIKEIKWCRKHQEQIVNKANTIYNLCTTDSNYKGKSRCLDFKRLEKECEKYKQSFRDR